MSIWTERSASREHKPNATTEHLFRSSKDVLIEERRFVASLCPLQFVLICKIKDSLSERARFFYFFIYSFRDSIENELKQFYICISLSIV